MKQETLIQIVGLLILILLSLFYDPLDADTEGKILFLIIFVAFVLFFVIFDVYNEIKENRIKIQLFDEKWNITERIKKLERLNKIEDEKEK